MSEAQKIPPIEMRLSSKKTFGPEDFALLEEACKTIQDLKACESELLNWSVKLAKSFLRTLLSGLCIVTGSIEPLGQQSLFFTFAAWERVDHVSHENSSADSAQGH